MSHRIRPGLARTLVRAAVLVLACLLRALVPVPVPVPVSASSPDVFRRPPGYRVRVAGAEIPVLPPYLLRFRRRTAAPRPAARIRPYLVAYEQRVRRRALVLALDGVDVGPRVIHGHRVGRPVARKAAAPMGVAA